MTSLNKTQYLGQVRELWAIFLFFLALITKFFSHVSVFINRKNEHTNIYPASNKWRDCGIDDIMYYVGTFNFYTN